MYQVRVLLPFAVSNELHGKKKKRARAREWMCECEQNVKLFSHFFFLISFCAPPPSRSTLYFAAISQTIRLLWCIERGTQRFVYHDKIEVCITLLTFLSFHRFATDFMFVIPIVAGYTSSIFDVESESNSHTHFYPLIQPIRAKKLVHALNAAAVVT